jgi:hypothetical protein
VRGSSDRVVWLGHDSYLWNCHAVVPQTDRQVWINTFTHAFSPQYLVKRRAVSYSLYAKQCMCVGVWRRTCVCGSFESICPSGIDLLVPWQVCSCVQPNGRPRYWNGYVFQPVMWYSHLELKLRMESLNQ